MATLADLRTTILDDLNRSDMTAAAEAAIKAAADHYGSERWWFNERRAHLAITPSNSYYGLTLDDQSAQILEVDSVLINVGGNVYTVNPAGPIEMDKMFTSVITGAPAYYTIYGQQMRFFPTPDITYTASMTYQYLLPEMTSTSSTVWVNELKELVRYRSQWDLYTNKLHNAERAAIAKQSEMETYRQLRRRYGRSTVSAPIKSWM